MLPGRQTSYRSAIPFSFQYVADGQRHKKAVSWVTRTGSSEKAPDGSRCRTQTPSASAPGPNRHGNRIPGTGPTRDALAPPRRHRTKGDRHRAAAPETDSAV